MTYTNTYYVEYYTKTGSRVGLEVHALSVTEAEQHVKCMPDYQSTATYPRKID